VYFGVAWFFEDHKIGHVLPAFKDMLLGDGMVDKGDLGVEHFLSIVFQVFKSFHHPKSSDNCCHQTCIPF
jgi:hypothetical protein